MFVHGFLDTDDANALVLKGNNGTFLVRFSSREPECYALVVNYRDQPYLWRVSTAPLTRALCLDGREFRNFQELADTYQREPLPGRLQSDGAQGEPTDMFLSLSVPRRGVR